MPPNFDRFSLLATIRFRRGTGREGSVDRGRLEWKIGEYEDDRVGGVGESKPRRRVQ